MGKGHLIILLLKAICDNSTHKTAKLLSTHCQSLHHLRQLHAYATVSGGLISDPLLASFLSFAAAQPRSLRYAVSLFDRLRNPTTFSYNNIIRAHSLSSSPLPALRLFRRLRSDPRLSPDSHTFPFALSACARLAASTDQDAAAALSAARALHSQSLKLGFIADSFLTNALIKAYSASGCVSDACFVFHGFPAHLRRRDVVSFNTLIDALAKSGDLSRARQMFDEMPDRDSVSWGTMISGYARSRRGAEEALRLFSEMVGSGARPDNVAVVAALSACAQLGDLDRGRLVREYIDRNRIRHDSFVTTALVDLYAKCGAIEEAEAVFRSSPEKSLCAWNAMIGGLAVHGLGRQCLEYFREMTTEAKVKPDGATFMGLLAGCSHSGMVAEAREVLRAMEEEHGTRREGKHYGCMADVLGRAGLVAEAAEMARLAGDARAWGGVLGGCRVHGEVGAAEEAVRRVGEGDGGARAVMAGVYAAAGRWEEVARVREEYPARMRRKAGWSLVRLGGGGDHEFVAGDSLHPLTSHIYFVLTALDRHQSQSYL